MNSNIDFIDQQELENIIKSDLKKNELSADAKKIVYFMIQKMLKRNNFKRYDEDTKGDMMLLAFEYINRYWTNYKEYRYDIIIDKDVELSSEDIENINEIKGIKIDNKNVKIQNLDFLPDIKRYLREKNIKFVIKKVKNSIFSYFSSYIWNAFVHVINSSKFMYKSGSSRYTGTSIYSLDKDSNLNEKDTNYDDILIQNDSEFSYNVINTEVEREDNIIYDRHEIIDIILKNSRDIDDIINISYKFTEESPKNTKIIYNDPSLLYILMKNIY